MRTPLHITEMHFVSLTFFSQYHDFFYLAVFIVTQNSLLIFWGLICFYRSSHISAPKHIRVYTSDRLTFSYLAFTSERWHVRRPTIALQDTQKANEQGKMCMKLVNNTSWFAQLYCWICYLWGPEGLPLVNSHLDARLAEILLGHQSTCAIVCWEKLSCSPVPGSPQSTAVTYSLQTRGNLLVHAHLWGEKNTSSKVGLLRRLSPPKTSPCPLPAPPPSSHHSHPTYLFLHQIREQHLDYL